MMERWDMGMFMAIVGIVIGKKERDVVWQSVIVRLRDVLECGRERVLSELQ